MNFWAISALINSLTSFTLGIIVYFRDRKSERALTYGLFCLSLFVWSIAYFFWQLSETSTNALFWSRTLMAGAVFIPITYLHHIYSLVNKTTQKKLRIWLSYIFAFLSSVMCYSPLFIPDVSTKLSFKFWPNAGILFLPFLLFWFLFVSLGLVTILKSLKTAQGMLRNQLKYVLIATILGWVGGATNFPLWFDIKIFPVGNILISVYVIIVAYAIVKYRLMDIRLAVTKASIFVLVYSFVLGIPFLIAFVYQDNLFNLMGRYWWLVPLLSSTIFATVGPFTYLFLIKEAENRLFVQQKKYQNTLRSAARGMGRIKDLRKLLKLIVRIVKKAIPLEYCGIFLSDKDEAFVLEESRGGKGELYRINNDSCIVNILKEKKDIIALDEMKHRADYNNHDEYCEVIDFFNKLNASIIIPIFSQQNLVAFLCLGNKKFGGIFTEDDITVFSILSDQVALAIENCIFWEESKKRVEQDGYLERVASLDHMASSFAHEIQNPIQGVTGHIFLVNEEMQNNESNLPKEFVKAVSKSLGFIKECVNRISSMVGSILEYSRLGTGELSPINIKDIILGFNDLIMPEIRQRRIQFEQEIENDLPLIKGNKVQIEEVLINLAENSIHALKNVKAKRIKLKIFRKSRRHIRIEFSDNGYGIPKEIIKDIFLASVTTKGSVEGTGLGLFRSRKIIDNHMGKIWAESEGKGAKFIIEI